MAKAGKRRKKGSGSGKPGNSAHYRELAKRLRKVTAVDYSSRKHLTPADKGKLTRAANLAATGTFVPIRKHHRESKKKFAERVASFQRAHALPVNKSLRGVVAELPTEAKRIRITAEEFSYEIPPKRTKHGGRGRMRLSTKTGYRIKMRRDEEGEIREISSRVRESIKRQLQEARRGHRGPIELFARIGGRLNSRLTIYDEGDLDDMVDEIEERLTEYAISGVMVITARSA
jgi:hypothetical protein